MTPEQVEQVLKLLARHAVEIAGLQRELRETREILGMVVDVVIIPDDQQAEVTLQ